MAFAAEKIMLRWQNMLLAPAYSSWNDHVKELLHKKRVLEKMARRMRNAGMYKAWGSWCVNVTDQQRQRAVLEKTTLRMRSVGLYKAWVRWEEQWRQEKKMRRSAEKVVSRRRNMLIAPALLALKESAEELKGMRNAGAKVILRWQRLGLSNGFYGWGEHAATQKRMAFAAEKIVLRWRHLAISPAMPRWTEYVSEKHRMARSAEKVAHRMQKMKLWSAFAKLEQETMSSRDSDARTGACAALGEGVDKSIATATMRLIGSSFKTWHLRSQDGDPVAVSLTMDSDFDQMFRTFLSRSSFETQPQDDICSTLSIERERVTIRCHLKGSVVSEIVFGNLDVRQLAHQLVTYVEHKHPSIVKTRTGKQMKEAEVHGPVCEGTVRALVQAQTLASTANSKRRALCEWDASSRKVSSKFSKFTDPTKFARTAVARLNWGASLAGADNIKRLGCITATHATIALCEWEASLREMSSKLSNLAKLRKFVRIDGARIYSGAPLAGAGDGEQTGRTAATTATLALCERDASSRKVSSKLPKATSLKKVDLIDERGRRYQTKGKFGGNGSSSRIHSPGKDNHETARGPQ
jgi:hypothetical protein